MAHRRLTPLQVLALCDLSVIAMAGASILWCLMKPYMSLWMELLLLAAFYFLHRRYERRFRALTRLARHVARSLPLPERRVRYHWV